MSVINAARMRDRMVLKGLSQSELARRVGVSQATIYNLVSGKGYGSTHLHKIARELETTPAYLTGETDDPDLNAPPPPAPAPRPIMMAVTLPSEDALTVMFKALLAGIDRSLGEDVQARLLARRLPIGLEQLQFARSSQPSRAARKADEDHAMPDRELSR